MSEDLQHLVETAEESIRAAASIADADPSRPRYHFRAPAQWMDDPNGIIFHEGWYHMMYSLNPHSAVHRAGMVYKTAVRVWDPKSPDWTGGITVWGHARSRDLAHWEHLPIALYPSIDRGEHFIWFGCTTINGEGRPVAIYTAVGPEMRPEDTAQQWAALGDESLLRWRPAAENPILSSTIHGHQTIREWRDPFVFKEGGRAYMILGGRELDGSSGRPVVALYEAANARYTKWQYKGILFRHPRGAVPSVECPNLAKIDGRWVLLVSPHGPVEYYIGNLDLAACAFSVEQSGVVDHSHNFYATNVLFDGTGRPLMWGAVEGFTNTSGWNGCVSLPRELRVTERGLEQRPAKELQALRGSHTRFSGAVRRGEKCPIARVAECEALELQGTIQHGKGAEAALRVIHERGVLELAFGPSGVAVNGKCFEAQRTHDRTDIHLYVDRTVIELFVDRTTVAAYVVPLMSGAATVEIEGTSGPVTDAALDVWTLNARGLFSNYRAAR